MSKNSVNDSRPEHKPYTLFPSDGLYRRVYPALQAEIGEDQADLLLQLDYWLQMEGQVIDHQRWLHWSARDIQRRSFWMWGVRKVQIVLRDMLDHHLINVIYNALDHSDQTPYISLGPEIDNLTSIFVFDDKVEDFTDLPSDSDITRDKDTHHSLNTKVIRPRDQMIAPPRSNDRTPAINGSHPHLIYKDQDQDQIEDDPGVPLDPWTLFCITLSEICQIDFQANTGLIRSKASRLWKTQKYTVIDLIHFAQWFRRHDWRGKKGEPPTPELVVQLIHQATRQADPASYYLTSDHIEF